MAKSGIVVGLNKGHVVTPFETKQKISYKKGALSKRSGFVRNIVREVAGLAPYEKRLVELIRNSSEKRAKKLAKKRLGTLKRSKRKLEDVQNILAEQRRH